jgi:RimJ/RimL family protein N-acetyltransferase
MRRLEGEVVVLEPLELRHAADLYDASRDEAVWRWLPRLRPTRAELDALIADAVAACEAGVEGPYATVDRARGRAIGSTRYGSLRPEHRSLEIGWTWLHPSAWSTGANVEAKYLMLRRAFEELDCLRVEFKTASDNMRSRRALEAIGATFEGVHRKHMLVRGGERRDSAWYSIVDEEWPDVKALLERRLATRSERSRAGRPAGR